MHLITKVSSAEAVVEEILKYMREENLKPGDRLPSVEKLARTTGVSEATVREALRGLAMMNVIEIKHGAGTFVRIIPQSSAMPSEMFLGALRGWVSLEELLECRHIVEEQTAALAAQRATDEDFFALKNCVQRMAQADNNDLPELGIEFHALLTHSCRNRLLIQIYNVITQMLREYQVAYYLNCDCQQEFVSHQELLSQIMSRDVTKARRAMRKHLDQSHKAMMAKNMKSNDSKR